MVGKQAESAEITSFYLAPSDGGAVPEYRPGQYVSVRIYVPELGLMQPRQYSLSDAPGQDRLRISVKREPAGAQTPAGRVSNALHDRLEEGGVLDVAPPQGDFHLKENSDAPVVLLSGGVGLTPMVSIDPYAGAVAALSCFAIAGQRAGALAEGPGSFAWRFLDALAALDADSLARESPLR